MIRVFSQGMPPDSFWVEPLNTWADIVSGKIANTKGLFISVETARRLIAEAHAVGAATSATDWCGSESGTPRSVGYSMVRDDEGPLPPLASEPAYDESNFERRQRIADEIGDRKLDQQNDNT